MLVNADGKNPKVSIAIRLVLLVLLPFVLGCFVFPHEYYAEGVAVGAAGQGMQTYTFSSQSHEILMEKSMGSVFPLYKYIDYAPFVTRDMVEICAANVSDLALPNGTLLKPEMEWSIGGSEGIENRNGAVFCADVPAESQLQPQGQGGANATNMTSGSTIAVSLASNAHPRYEVEYGVLQGLVLVPVFYLLVFYPATEIWKKLHRGMHA
jgi:hypothetical protein